MSKKSNLTEDQIIRRVLYIGDRIAFGASILFITIMLLSLFFNSINLTANILHLFLVLLGFVLFFIYYIIKEDFYYSVHIFLNSNFIIVQLIWFCWTIPIMALLAEFTGWIQIIDVTLTYLLLYITGYIFGRIIWKGRKIWNYGYAITLAFIFVLILLIPFIPIGAIMMGVNVHIGALFIVYGVGALIIMGITYYTLHLYYKKSGLNVLEDPPSKLVIIGLINTMIINFIIWIILCIAVPIPPVGGGGGKGKKSSRGGKVRGSGSIRRTRYIHHGYFGRRVVAQGLVHPRASVYYYWVAALGEEERPEWISEEDIKKAKENIIDVLAEELVVPTSKDLQEIIHKPHIIMNIALDELREEKKVTFHPCAISDWWGRGFTLTKEYAKDLKVEEFSEEKYQAKVKELLTLIKKKQPIKGVDELWDIGFELGIRPRWKINTAIDSFKKERKVKYQRKRPRGWYVVE